MSFKLEKCKKIKYCGKRGYELSFLEENRVRWRQLIDCGHP